MKSREELVGCICDELGRSGFIQTTQAHREKRVCLLDKRMAFDVVSKHTENEKDER